jgi:hypothetical protein
MDPSKYIAQNEAMATQVATETDVRIVSAPLAGEMFLSDSRRLTV